MLKIQFRTRRVSVDKVSVYIRCTLRGLRWPSDIAIGVNGPPHKWIPGKYQFDGKTYKAENSQITAFAAMVQEIAENLEREGSLTHVRLHAAVRDRNVKQLTLVQLAERFAVDFALRKSESTRITYRCWLQTVKEFVGSKPVFPEDVTNGWLKRFDRWNETHPVHPCASAYTRRRKIEKVIACLAWGRENGHVTRPSEVASYRPQREPSKPPIFLTRRELERFQGLADCERVRDCFIFSAYTGLAYTDLRSFDRQTHTYQDELGRTWIRKPRTKTKVEAEIPLLPEAEAVLRKYGHTMPVPSNQEYNRTLKLLAAKAGIDKPVTTHVARKTCAARLLNLGINENVIAKFMGWNSTAMLKIYAAVTMDGMERELPKLGL